MITPGGIRDNFTEPDGSEERPGRSSLIKVISILMALAITATLLIGFMIWRKRHEERLGVEPQAQSKATRPALPAKVQVYMDEAVRKGSQALIGGTVHNISNEALSNLSLEIQLTRPKDASTEVRSLDVEPKELAPDQKGRYSLTLTGDYDSVKLLSIKSGPDAKEIGFKKAPGAPRPVERPPETKTIIVNRPSAPKQGEEFINTPDNPAKIP
jgi:uncharacterized protein YneF (UPF0154 family)